MQIKARMKYHLTPTRMATIKKEKQGEFSGGLVVRIPHFHCYSLGSIPGGRKKKTKPENNKCWQGYMEIGNFTHCWNHCRW